ncbi:L,D-transpeptidase family protein [Methylobacterium sp. NI91]|nr:MULTISPECIES: L,D-transpeptidase [unclassified Methylobacterium]QIJ76980.1 L,D-transpeptidase family protein [Methylobacterium sp. CLZ]QIJ81883.1 L,D-transpeptidase family protein [Methylobacterium sp. NI91]
MRSGSLAALSSLLLTTVLSLPAAADVRIRVDQTSQRMSVSVDGRQLYHWPVSTGLLGHRTPNGSFRALRMEGAYFSRKYDNAPMPHAVFFTSVGHAIHGTRHVRRLGRAASHGCVRLSPSNAAALFSIVEAEGLGNTQISVVGSEPLVASNRARGFRTASHRQRDDYSAVPAGFQTHIKPVHGHHSRVMVETSYRQPTYAPYRFDPDNDSFE